MRMSALARLSLSALLIAVIWAAAWWAMGGA
jgi:hypothetical protein